jgi:MFS family permease
LNDYLSFLRDNFRQLTFGWLLTLFSSFGQTFLISLYVPFILTDLSVSKTEFGTYYAIATVIASLLLLRVGHVIDDHPVRPFTNKTIALLGVSTLLMSVVWTPWILFIALIGLRLGGQGLMTHISMTVMSRQFDKNRGKALSISSLGFSMGEMIFPLLMGLFIGLIGWRYTIATGAAFLTLFFLSLRWINIESMDVKSTKKVAFATDRNQEAPVAIETTSNEPEEMGKRAFYWQMLQEKRFYILALPSFLLSFTATGFFFYQYLLAETRGWDITVYTLLFAGYGAVRLVFSLFGGILTDKYSGINLFVYHLIPMGIGAALLSVLPGYTAAVLFLLLFGITVGTSAVVKPAIIAEIYGIHRIGQIRSLFTVVMVTSTALAPLIYGIALDLGVTFEQIGLISFGLVLLATLHTFRIYNYKKTT